MHCPPCGTPMTADENVCATCGGSVSHTTESSRPPVQQHTAPLPAPVFVDADGFAAPPAAAQTDALPERAPNRAGPLLLAAAMLLLVGLFVGGWSVLNLQRTAAAPGATSSATSPVTAPPPVATSPVSESPEKSVVEAAPRTVTVTRQPDRTVYVGPSADPAPRNEVPSGSYILVLESLPQSSYSRTDAERRAEGFSGSVLVLDSSSTPGLNSGYWAIAAGPFGSKSAASSACSDFGRALGGSCYPREIG